MKRPVLFAALAALVIVLVTWLVVRWSDAEPPLPPVAETTSPAPAPAPVRVEAPSPVAPPAPPEPADAGSARAQREVRFTVREDGKSVVGERLELMQGKRRVSGPLNVMGEVVLPLEDGEWTVYRPGPMRPRTVTVGPGVEQVSLEVLDFTVSGVVVNQKQEPVRGEVRHGRIGWGTDLEGRFIASFDDGEPVTIWAEAGLARSLPTRIRPPAKNLVFVVEDQLTFTVATNTVAAVIVRHRGGFERCNSTPCTVRVLSGEVIASAVGPRGGVMLTAHKAGQVNETTTWQLTLAPPKPLKGKLINAQGEPIAGATIRLEGVALTSDEFIGVGGTPRLLGSKSTGLTNRRGEFSVPWPDANELFFAVSTDAPISLERRVYVVPGDGPLQLTAAP